MTLSHPSGAELTVALRGATVLAWRAPWGARGAEQVEDLLDGYTEESELLAQDATRSGFMFPFANRLADGTYVFDGARHLMPLSPRGDADPARVRPRPGLGGRPGRRCGRGGASDAVALTLATLVRGADLTGYPFDVSTQVRFELTRRTLGVTWSYRNVGQQAAPVTAGWHPYFRIPGHDTIDGLELHVPARSTVATDARLIPLEGEAARVARDAVGPLALAGTSLDTAFTDLVPDADGRARTRVLDPATGRGLELWQEHGNMHVYTGDGLGSRARASIALEPVESLTNAFNRADCSQQVRLEPGRSGCSAAGSRCSRRTAGRAWPSTRGPRATLSRCRASTAAMSTVTTTPCGPT
ncbi:aldose 1-epimerase [Oerskovia sp. M15]